MVLPACTQRALSLVRTNRLATRLKAPADGVDGRRKSSRWPCTVPIEASWVVSTVCGTPRDKVFSAGLNEVVFAASVRLMGAVLLCCTWPSDKPALAGWSALPRPDTRRLK
ncbi:MAG: hypothetical protein IPM99_19850 [Rubrivivax sp.]|nr:hypothetical protein [Rubrivivax sp.]